MGMRDDDVEKLRKKPKQDRSKRTILTIFEATAQILRSDGEKALTTNRVAERAGFSIGTLYQYFPSMDAILLAMIARERDRVLREQEAIIARGEDSDVDPVELVRLFIRSLIANFGVASSLNRTLLKRAWRLDHTEQVIASTQAMASRIREAMNHRAHPDFPPPSEAALFVATRAVLGAIRAAVLEDWELIGSPQFEDALTSLAISLLRAAAKRSIPGPASGSGVLAVTDAENQSSRSNAPRSIPPPTRICLLPAWLAAPTTPSFSMRSTSEAALL
jgi:AcrR family transcriptional regulator